ncbi:hypothetical protein EV191_103190 [Tamaricihabitans halophyticus]|uniref:Uncharacterized protein n=1 Tax=Tamaricihabitans halophyticus TaxID=1262583 RepID=A0A4R2QY91_9PSEU|nr:hypothetical protein [Tamaricihabitans halophyticus]TCP54149.1 hypothetical protein EV191_103190 [Tamaricihabitans halophyticus]
MSTPHDGLPQHEYRSGQRQEFQGANEMTIELVDAATGEVAKRILWRVLGGAVVIFLASVAAAFVAEDVPVLNMLTEGLVIAAPVAWVCLALLVPKTEALGDWQSSLADRAGSADTVFGVTYRSLLDHHAVPATVQARRVRTGPPVPGVHNVLYTRIGTYHVLILACAFGNDLYAGWTLWRRQVPLLVVARGLRTLLRADRQLGGLVEMAPVKALRAAVHDAVRQGIAVAAVEEVPMSQTFGHDVDTVDVRNLSVLTRKPRVGGPAHYPFRHTNG